MKLGSANIKNYPDMPKEKVIADGKEMCEKVDVWGMQENDPDEDFPAIIKNVPEKWNAKFGENSNLPIFFLGPEYDVIDQAKMQMPFDPVLPKCARPRLITSVTMRKDDRDGLPPWVIINCHFIAGGYNGDKEPARRNQWDCEWECLVDFLKGFKKEGYTIFLIGDFNNPNTPKPVDNFKWVVGADKIDRIGATTDGSVYWALEDTGTIQLNSDHNGIWARLNLDPA